MQEVVIIDAVRTPMGRSKGGIYRQQRAETLSAAVIQALLTRNPEVPPEQIEDVVWGCVMQTLEQGFNIARHAAILAGLPYSTAAVTVNRLCGSSMQALHDAARAIMTGMGDIFIVGGVEHMGHVPMTHGLDFHPALNKRSAQGATNMGLTAELLATKFSISRQQQDEFAARSHQLAATAQNQALFDNEKISVAAHNADGFLMLAQDDEVIRADSEAAKLAKLPPAFSSQGTVTAGNASALSDGAAALLIMSADKAKQLGLQPMARVRSMAVSGCDPSIMGYGPVPATLKALKRANLSLNEIDLFEFNEAFAVQTLTVLQALELTAQLDNKINQHGGAIALGHPLGCSGARICTTLLHLMQQRSVKLGLASMCIGMGQGITTIFERV
ncbi:acetyl-CoA C-acyltransferase FadA [Gayadomonas joobiniege]|uniref:acetyl-CoA C-acyltransferase FadA n=1 Tax=Gayadomonas joobiniege TaxID=1234606 RepID=UPI0003769328|nr:acetyl-CoA C-acyltransferase FadA [Gayadomonas joobiniege]